MGRKLKLTLENEIDFSVLAMSTNFKMHRVCHTLNSNFDLDFHRADDYVLERKEGVFMFPICVSSSNDYDTSYFLLKNNHQQACLLPEVKNTDFILVAKGRQCDSAIQHFHEELKQLDTIQASFLLEEGKLKHIHNLLFDNDFS